MHIFGKILGAFFGLLLGGPFGLLFGLFIGHQFDKARRLSQAGFSTSGFGKGPSQAQRQEEFFKAAFAVMGHVAKAKGQVTKEEIQLATAMMDRMNLHGDQRRAAQDAFREGKESDFPLEEVLVRVKISTAGRFDLLQFFLELQISAAFADGEIHPSERNVLHKIARALGFSSDQLERRLQMQEAAFRFQHQGGFNGQHQGQYQSSGAGWQQASQADHLADAYKILGVSSDADSKAVKRAYRKLMNEHHPDKLMAKGLPPEMMNVAKEKSQEIQNAYDLIKKVKGFK
ncbi:co-chaperone DjlA [Vibrio alginolyticus]|uniref:co-chaperone DjlA n=1 Tax=Vibrio sp. B1FLJ16 TaxID=2751178 RepID=UPI0015F503F3|nr:co-chaperone DjlA [Vibrio sp. B1FLJ16]CAD7798314.1 Regulatory DnaK co-chaperone. Direct interaction between DnaK and DjlA is needed for the induction of the wcaABCDE operon [Vibrio sp. B1FLJ16]CAD7798351.1 Regulatory DnaK co-chaperone. Direct interaction between DnaK and DjlA is needed for the induction of the wcaABCDE operon [Vibrio sp. B1FLJ16]CAE6882606.1 Regulatory DnaK co-chaperone. Direct interaction between DnaK and DjlA is needed for the induction of the wcaABCDE operon [Vibrio sp. B1